MSVESYRSTLEDLNVAEQQYVDELTSFKSYIDQNVLWIQSGRPVTLGDWPAIRSAAGWLLQPNNWKAAISALSNDLRTFPHVYALGGLLFGALLALARKMPERLRKSGELASKRQLHILCAHGTTTAISCLLALTIPVIIMFVGWRLYNSLAVGPFVVAVADGLSTAAVALVFFYIPLQILRKGPRRKHFMWPGRAIRELRRLLLLLMFVVPADDPDNHHR